MTDPNATRARVLDEMSRERGYLPAPWAYMADQDIDFLVAYNDLYRRALHDGKALPIRVKELVAIGILAFRGNTDGVYEHAKRVLRCGGTKQELLEAIEAALIPGGAPTFATGLRALMRIEEEERAAAGGK
jgi:alkylhydroperoxidase/carboxymuconolactone decarboxylase family protein YurZ